MSVRRARGRSSRATAPGEATAKGTKALVPGKAAARAVPRRPAKTTGTYVARAALGRPRSCLVHDNGGRPFRVVASREEIVVFTYRDDAPPELTDADYTVRVRRFRAFAGFWTGHDPACGQHGNSVLVHLGGRRYVSIGESIYRFTAADELVDYVSPLGNSDVPYPVAFGVENVYFMLDKVFVPRAELTTPVGVATAEQLYGEFYGHLAGGPHTGRPMSSVVILAERR